MHGRREEEEEFFENKFMKLMHNQFMIFSILLKINEICDSNLFFLISHVYILFFSTADSSLAKPP